MAAAFVPALVEAELNDVGIGSTVEDNYDILEIVGLGTFGTVYRAWDYKREKEIAMKALMRESNDSKKMYVNEVRMLSKVANSAKEFGDINCVGFICSFVHKGFSWICMDLCGKDLMAYMMDYAELGFPIKEVRYILKEILKGVDFLHYIGIIHTDLKTENIAFLKKCSPKQMGIGRIKIIDFGHAVSKGNESSRLVSTPFYRAIEVWLGNPWDSKIDLWSVGCIALELFTGKILLDTTHDHSYLRWTEKLLQQSIPDSLKNSGNLHYFKNSGSVDYCPECSPTPEMAELSDLLLCDDTGVHTSFRILCLSLLEMDPTLRISAEEALSHEFFGGISEIDGDGEKKNEEEDKEKEDGKDDK